MTMTQVLEAYSAIRMNTVLEQYGHFVRTKQYTNKQIQRIVVPRPATTLTMK